MGGQIFISARGPVDSQGRHIAGNDIPFSVEDKSKTNVDKSLMVHRAAADQHCRILQEVYGKKVQPYTKEEIERRALADEDGKDAKDSSAYLYEPLEEQCEKRGIDPDKFRARETRVLETRSMQIPAHKLRALERRGLDGGTDTALVGVDYAHEWFRELRLAGKLVPQFSRQMDLPVGYATWTGPVVGDAQFLKQGALTTNTFAVNTAVNPTSTVVTLAPQKLQAVIFVSGELTEDSLAPIIENIKMSMVRGANVALEHILINGDTLTTTANINSYAVTALGSLDPRLCWDGLRKLDWASTYGKSAGAFSGANGSNGIVTLNGVTDGLKSMGKYADDPSRVLTIMPVKAEKEILEDTKARPDTYSSLMTTDASGRLVAVSGSRVFTVGNSVITNESSANVPTYDKFMSEGYPTNLAATGLYTGSGATHGFCQVREDNCIWGWKRQFTFRVVDLPLGDQVAITATLRVQMVQVIAGAGVSCSYNWS